MKVIPREAKRITYSTKIREMKNISLTNFQKAVIVGNILGDGCLCENWSKTNYRLKINHSVKQKEYIFWKYEILKNIVLSEPKIYKPTQAVGFRTISHPELTSLWEMFYRDKRKIIPKNIKEFLKDPIVLAVWFMDDGNVRKSKNNTVYGFHINTQSFTFEENEMLVKALKDNFGIVCAIHKNKGKHRIYVLAQSKRIFASTIIKHTIPSMYYKFG